MGVVIQKSSLSTILHYATVMEATYNVLNHLMKNDLFALHLRITDVWKDKLDLQIVQGIWLGP